ncbi:hypothetical protein J2S50_000057 [Streptomyces sp. DSM 40167]|nr:hypothetical protein [Streptomyces sp. DSM 40167]
MKVLAGFMPTIAPSRQAALQRRRFLDEVVDLNQRVRYLGAMIGLPLGPGQLDEPLTADQFADAIPSPRDPRSARALELAREGWTLRDVLSHGVIDYRGPAGVPRRHGRRGHRQDGDRPHGTTVSTFASHFCPPPIRSGRSHP